MSQGTIDVNSTIVIITLCLAFLMWLGSRN